MDYLNIVSVPAIAGVAYALIEVLKKIFGNNEKFLKFIPLIALAIGAISGLICFFCLPEIIPAKNVVLALVIGGASGLTATGTNQIFKQLANKEEK